MMSVPTLHSLYSSCEHILCCLHLVRNHRYSCFLDFAYVCGNASKQLSGACDGLHITITLQTVIMSLSIYLSLWTIHQCWFCTQEKPLASVDKALASCTD